jgi:uncharacterized protein (TIGR03435 family)
MAHGSIRQIVVLLAAALGGAHYPLPAQTAAAPAVTPAYDIASIHQNLNPNPRWRMEFTPDGVHATDVTLLWALHEAYGVFDGDLMTGGPTWIDQRRIDIEAKYDVAKYPGLTREQRQVMLQQLLADRFKVVVHHVPKEYPLYALVVAKNGPKFKETAPEDLNKSPVYGVMCVGGGRKGTIEMHGCKTSQLADNLSGYGRSDLGRKVVDQTGLTGDYTFILHWAPTDAKTSSGSALSAEESSGPSIFTAVREQLGLELRPTTGQLDTIVIDRAEMPSAN